MIGCESIGKKWVKNCPECGREQPYKWKKSFLKACKENSRCKYCQDNSRKIQEIRKCIICGIDFSVQVKSKQKFCSLKCHYHSGLQKYPRKIKQCQFCDKDIQYLEWETKWHPVKFCSNKCRIGYQMNNFGIKTIPEQKMECILKKLFKEVKYNFEINGKYYDFYIPEKKMLVEVDGSYWHGKNVSENNLDVIQQKVKHNDFIKDCIAEEMGYTLIRFWEDELEEDYVSKCVLRPKE